MCRPLWIDARRAASHNAARIQEAHILFGHILCDRTEQVFGAAQIDSREEA